MTFGSMFVFPPSTRPSNVGVIIKTKPVSCHVSAASNQRDGKMSLREDALSVSLS